MSLDALGIACQDINETVEFYSRLGIDFKEVGEEHYEGTTKSGLRLMLDSYELMKKINPQWQEPKAPGITLCFLQDSPEQVDAVYHNIVSNGATSVKEPWDAFWGQRYASVLDPSGNQVDIFCPL